jgi:peroxiredoxin
MARTESTNIALGFKAPEFTLTDTRSGKSVSLKELKSDVGTVIIFMCNHCPYVVHVMQGILALANDYMPKGFRFAGISANDVQNYPDDSPEKMKELANKLNFNFPYLYDESQEVAKAYDAACTPEFHIFDKDLKCVYRGQLDGARPSNEIPVTGNDVRRALDNLLAGKPVDTLQYPSIGCNIKWKLN